MLSAIREIGKWRIKEGNKSSFDVLIQEPFKERKDKETDNVLFIQINFENNSFVGILFNTSGNDSYLIPIWNPRLPENLTEKFYKEKG